MWRFLKGIRKYNCFFDFAGDLSSISGSESDSDEEDTDSDGRGTGSNITGTDNESSAEPNATTGRLNSKVVFQNSAGEYLSIHRCALMGKVKLSRYTSRWDSSSLLLLIYSNCIFQADSDEHDVVSSLKSVNQKTVWVILMTGGGHFAGAIFEGFVHLSDHCNYNNELSCPLSSNYHNLFLF